MAEMRNGVALPGEAGGFLSAGMVIFYITFPLGGL